MSPLFEPSFKTRLLTHLTATTATILSPLHGHLITTSSSIVTWTSLISHLSRSRHPLPSLSLFSLLLHHHHPNPFTLSSTLPACSAASLPSLGRQIHSLSLKHGLHADPFVATALITMYATTASSMAPSLHLFDKMPHRNLVSWNSLLVGFIRNRLYADAINTFRQVLGNTAPDQVTLSSVLSACANSGGVHSGRCVHGRAIKGGLDSLAYVRNGLVDMYLKCWCLGEAKELFDGMEMENRDVVSWNIMMTSLVQTRRSEEGFGVFCEMLASGIRPDEASFCTVLQALWNIASWGHGAVVHALTVKTGAANYRNIGSPLITMYSKCGCLEDAERFFEEIRHHLNVVSWTAMIAALQQHGHGDRGIELFDRMLEEGIEPDYITFVCVISACSHKGLVDQGFRYFDSMSRHYNISPGGEHYACIVDMLGRAGRLEEAKGFIDRMPIKPDASVWGALLAACRNCGDLELGRQAAEKLFEIEPQNSGNYVLLANMYACHGRLEEARQVRQLMGCKGVRKETGCSWIDIKSRSYVFMVHDRSHDRTKEIYEMLKKLECIAKEKGHVADTRFAANDAEGFKEQGLWYHSERLALAFGLISLPADAPIRIKKNLRTCIDCHAVMKIISEVLGREIVVRDNNRFHRFVGGSCSCGDYW